MVAISSARPDEYMDAKTNNASMSNSLDVFPDSGSWVKATFIVKLGEEFTQYKDILAYSLKDEIFSSDGKPALSSAHQELIDNVADEGEDEPIPKYLVKGKKRDTSLGGNDVINNFYQFNENDDIIHPFLAIQEGSDQRGMGRVYSEMIDDNQQIMYMTIGVPTFSGVTTFYADAFNQSLSTLMTEGDFLSIQTVGRLFGATIGTIVTLPILPIVVLKKIYDKLPDITDQKVTKYYNLKSSMPLYYRVVNTMLAHLAVNMGFLQNGSGSSTNQTTLSSENKSPQEQKKNADASQIAEETNLLGAKGFDIYTIMCKKYLYNRLADVDQYGQFNTTLDDIIDIYRAQGGTYSKDNEFSGWEKFLQGMGAGFRDSLTYVGFRINKSVDSSESVSNSTGESSLASMLNGKKAEMREQRFNLGNGNIDNGVIAGILSGIKGVIQGASSALHIDGLETAMMSSGEFDIPEVWKGSSFSKSYSFSMALRSPYGDPMSIMQSIYIPLCMLLAAALPRAVGQNAYTSPFLVSAYSRGMFSIPLGIIDSMSIHRGGDQHGWNYATLPTSVDISFSIKDLSPAMYLAIADELNWKDVLGQNSSFQEYLLTLSGVGLADRLLWLRNLKRRAKIYANLWTTQKLNPTAIGFSAANTKIGRLYTAILPTTDLGKYTPKK